ncbi:MAG: hypothetical protein OSJ59_17765, partial [Lachnospiraceae bacterium]|nr:hypothetical protein [Lachnospiraceae bacterium]
MFAFSPSIMEWNQVFVTPSGYFALTNKRLLKERLGAIMKFKEQSRTGKIVTVVLTLCVVLGAAFVGVYSLGPAAANAHAASLPGTSLDTAGRPSLSLDVSSAAVNVLAATDNK